MARDFDADDGLSAAASFVAPPVLASPPSVGAEARPPIAQLIGLGLVSLTPVLGLALAPQQTAAVLHGLGWAAFSGSTIWRAALLAISRVPAQAPPLVPGLEPTYTVIAPMYREAAMVRRLAEALCRLDYPPERLQVILALEADDSETYVAARDLPAMFEVMVCPKGPLRTKPRACNLALARARGEFVVVYDAEDRPDPMQLRQAAARFAAAGPELACVQAPLRIAAASRFVPRQFALEYAALFEVLLPALARIGAPFPLCGTSNHFRTDALRRVGGWDSYNVTEDADVGFRIAAAGGRIGMIAAATVELPPTTLDAWTPQRARWLKGYMQTWSVHMRRPAAGGLGRALMLQASVGLAAVSALAHAPLMLMLAANVLTAACAGRAPHVALADLGLLLTAWAVAVACLAQGARRAGGRLTVRDALGVPAYWLLQTVAFAHAAVQLVTRPHHWDKTPHALPVEEMEQTPCLDELDRERVSRAA